MDIFTPIGLALAFIGWREGADPSWMTDPPAWREAGLWIRTLAGGVMLGVAGHWLRERMTL